MGKGSSVDGMGKGSSMDSMMSNNRGVDSMGNRSVDGVGNNRGMDSVGNNRGMDSMGNNRSMDSVGNRGMDSMSFRVAGSSLIGDLSNESKVVVSMVGGGLDSAIRESNGVGSSNASIVILGFSLSEVGSTVVISYSI